MSGKIYIKWPVIIILVLGCIAFYFTTFLRSCRPFLDLKPVIQKTDTARFIQTKIKFDSTEKIISAGPIRIHDSIFVPTNLVVDTGEIIRRYLTAYFYVDSCRTSELSLIVSDTLFNNRITYRNYRYKILRPDSVITITTTITNTLDPHHIYLGGGLISSPGGIGIMPKLLYTKNKFAYDAGSVISWPQPNFYIGIYYKIK